MKNKRGEVGEDVLEAIIFLILNTVFFVVLLIFVYNVGTRSFVYEETYAKQIAMVIDNVEPEMAILMDINKAVEFAEKNKKSIEEIIQLDKGNNRVKVSFDKGGYSYEYFSDYDVDLKVDGNWLSIVVKEKEEVVKNNEIKNEGVENG